MDNAWTVCKCGWNRCFPALLSLVISIKIQTCASPSPSTPALSVCPGESSLTHPGTCAQGCSLNTAQKIQQTAKHGQSNCPSVQKWLRKWKQPCHGVQCSRSGLGGSQLHIETRCSDHWMKAASFRMACAVPQDSCQSRTPHKPRRYTFLWVPASVNKHIGSTWIGRHRCSSKSVHSGQW